MSERLIFWKPVVGFEGLYEVNDVGDVRRVAGSPKCRRTRSIKASIWGAGYWMVSLHKGNRHYLKAVHRLVAAAFLGDMPAPFEVNHIDGNKRNCHLANLEWTTSSGNHEHGHRVGLLANGERHYRARLTADLVRQIRQSTEPSRVWAEQVGVGDSYIRAIRRGERWKHV